MFRLGGSRYCPNSNSMTKWRNSTGTKVLMNCQLIKKQGPTSVPLSAVWWSAKKFFTAVLQNCLQIKLLLKTEEQQLLFKSWQYLGSSYCRALKLWHSGSYLHPVLQMSVVVMGFLFQKMNPVKYKPGSVLKKNECTKRQKQKLNAVYCSSFIGSYNLVPWSLFRSFPLTHIWFWTRTILVS